MRETNVESSAESLDLNLLRTLHALIQTRSVTRAGERLGLSQPAASRAVAKLRRLLADPLLVRTSKGYVLTPRAEAMSNGVASALHAAQQVFTTSTFDPGSAARHFNLATTDYGAMAVVAPLAPHLPTQAPGCTLSLTPWSDATLAALESGELDLAFYANDPLPPDFHSRELFVEDYVAVVRCDHPLTRELPVRPMAQLAALAAYPQVAMRYPSGRAYVTDDLLARLGAPPHRLALTLPYFGSAPWMLQGSDMVLLAPSRLARRFGESAGLAMLPIRADAERFTYRMIWHERAHRDGGVTWLRTLVSRIAGADPVASPAKQ